MNRQILLPLAIGAAFGCLMSPKKATAQTASLSAPATTASVQSGFDGGLPMFQDKRAYANTRDLSRDQELAARRSDWRNGAVVYQILVDRFVEPTDLDQRRALYPAPKKLRPWNEQPKQGTYVKEVEVWSHEIDFWGGSLKGLLTRMDYLKDLGVDVVYLNPIHMAYTNHKYDAQNYFEVSPEFGTRADVKAVADAAHARGMKLVLDGVINHMGRTSPFFKEAMTSATSPWREWYNIGPQYKLGYRAWVNVPNLPEVNLESEAVRRRLWKDADSVIQGYLRNEGVDGWRLDVGFDIGFRWLEELTRHAHLAKPGSVVIGEIWNYPEEWSPAVDGVMNMTMRELLLALCRGNLDPVVAGRQFEQMVTDTGIGPILKAWLILDNHDTPRLKHLLPAPWQQRMAQALQFTLPGSPCVYYGVEAGMTGGEDPANRGPMDWTKAVPGQESFDYTAGLIALRQKSPALKYGDFRLLETKSALAFLRQTDKVEELRMILANPTETTVTETMLLRDSKVMSYGLFQDLMPNPDYSAKAKPAEARCMAGTVTVEIPPRTVRIFAPVIQSGPEYTPYKRVQ
jgi:glycosidase